MTVLAAVSGCGAIMATVSPLPPQRDRVVGKLYSAHKSSGHNAFIYLL
jgi:hypothetical protein